jgi:hypothetical protein
MRKLPFFLHIGLIFLFAQTCFAQGICSGSQIFNSKICSGDEVSADETKLLQIINEYRAKNALPQVPISKPLSIVAHRHLLDLQQNLKIITHSWSDCPYAFNDEKTWNCVNGAPHRLKVDFNGQGYENLFRNLNGNAQPLSALEAWKKSELHNSLILNLGVWKNKTWNSIGVAINGQFAAIWFGSSNSSKLLAAKSAGGLGISFKEIVKNLESSVAIEKTSSVVDKELWVGKSKDKSIILELLGTSEDIERAGFSLRIKLDKEKNLTAKNHDLLMIFVNNVFPDSRDAEKWLDAHIAKILEDPKSTQSLIKDEKVMQIRIDTNHYLSLTAKPYKKTSAIEFE